MTQQPEPIIQIKNLYKQFGHVQALDGMDMKVNKGDIFGFLGPNGSGKSTTIRILLSLVNADNGEVEIFGMDSKVYRQKILQKTGALIERPDFYEHLSAQTNLKLLLKYGGRQSSEDEILETLKTVGLKERAKDKVRTFSDGMKQRLGIAQAIIHQPELLILDEPFNSLDPQGVKDIRDLILRLNRENDITILISSHNLDEVEKLVNSMVLINKGRSIAAGEIDELINAGASKIKLIVDNPEEAIAIIQQSEFKIDQIWKEGKSIQFFANQEYIPAINQLLVQNKIQVYQLSQDHSLESFFLSFMESL